MELASNAADIRGARLAAAEEGLPGLASAYLHQTDIFLAAVKLVAIPRAASLLPADFVDQE